MKQLQPDCEFTSPKVEVLGSARLTSVMAPLLRVMHPITPTLVCPAQFFGQLSPDQHPPFEGLYAKARGGVDHAA